MIYRLKSILPSLLVLLPILVACEKSPQRITTQEGLDALRTDLKEQVADEAAEQWKDALKKNTKGKAAKDKKAEEKK